MPTPRRPIEPSASALLALVREAYLRTPNRPPIRELAAEAKMAHTTLARLLHGTEPPESIAGLDRLLAALGYELRLHRLPDGRGQADKG